MEAQTLARAVSRTSAFTLPIRTRIPTSTTPATPSLTTIRSKSTANRTKRALNIAPHTSFLATPDTPPTSHIIFNPPSSAPSVYHTPFKFLPKSDPRRRANLNSLFSTSTTISFGCGTAPTSSSEDGLAPRVNHERYTADKYHLKKEDVEDIRRLRREDPVGNSVLTLAKKYNCSPIFIMMAVKSSAEHKAGVKQRLRDQKQKWGPIRTQARIDRSKRKEMLLRGEL